MPTELFPINITQCLDFVLNYFTRKGIVGVGVDGKVDGKIECE